MRGRNSKELEKLEAGLAQSKNLTEIISALQPQSAHHLYLKALYYTKWTGFMMAVAGIYFLALKEKIGHGNFKKYLVEERFPYVRAWECMKAAHVVSRHELFGKLRSSRPFRNLLMLPEPDQDRLAAELKEMPADRLDDLLPSLIQKRYDEIRREEQATRPRKSKVTPEIAEQAKRDFDDKEWLGFVGAWAAACAALGKLAKYPIKEEWRERIFDGEFLGKMGVIYGDVAAHLHPVDEVLKRAERQERASFAAH